MNKADRFSLSSVLSPSPIEVTNYDFLEKIFCQTSEFNRTLCSPVCVSFTRSPALASPSDWNGVAWDKVNEPKNVNFNSYFSLSAFKADSKGICRRKKSQFIGQFAIVFDDVTAKAVEGKRKAQISFDEIRLKPSWVLETSADNYQVGYILKEPITDIKIADTLSKEIIKKGLSDPGASGPSTRLMRLPVASNTKYSPVFKCKLRHWEPNLRYEVKDFLDSYGISLIPANKAKTPLPAKANTVSIADEGNSVWKPKPSTNIVLDSLKSRGLLKAEISEGKFDLSCPWKEEHTDQIDSGACYWAPDDEHPIGSFKCQHAHCQERNISDLLEFLSMTAEDAYMKDKIFMNPGEINRIVNSLEKILAGTGKIYQRGARIVSLFRAKNRLFLKEMNIHDLSIEMARLSRWYRYDSRSKSHVPIDPLPKYLTTVLESQNHKYLSPLEGVTTQPIIGTDGKIKRNIGYDPETQLYCSFDSDKFSIAPKLTEEDASKAINELNALLEEFQFEEASDRAAALCAMLTACLRSQLPFSPMFLITAHQPGTGKGVLTELIALFATPEKPSPIPFPKDSIECEKLLLAELLKAPSVLFFDNLTSDLYPHKYLCSAITSETLTGRVLGESRTTTVGTRSLFIANGNNVCPVGDMSRRTITINLDAKEEFPASRVFKNPQLLNQVRENREHYVKCALIVVMAWIQAGKPMKKVSPLNSFDQWSEWCRQPLLWLGYTDPLKNVFEAMADEPERLVVGRFFEAIKGAFGEKPFTAKELCTQVMNFTNSLTLRESLEDIGCFDGGSISRKKLGWWLKKKVGWMVNRIRLNRVSTDSHTKQPRYQLSIKPLQGK